MMPELHVDPINIVYMTALAWGAWYKFLRKSDAMTSTVATQGEWIAKHERACEEQRRVNNTILTELQKTNTHLTTLVELHEKRLDKLENYERASAARG